MKKFGSGLGRFSAVVLGLLGGVETRAEEINPQVEAAESVKYMVWDQKSGSITLSTEKDPHQTYVTTSSGLQVDKNTMDFLEKKAEEGILGLSAEGHLGFLLFWWAKNIEPVKMINPVFGELILRYQLEKRRWAVSQQLKEINE